MVKVLIGVLCLLLVLALIPVVVIACSAPSSPLPMASMAGPLSRVSFDDVPAPRELRARDGTPLRYYAYRAAPAKVAVLIHGSAGPGTSMHALAKALRDTGVSAYVLDIRGHGGSGRRGDIDYIGQIDDDLADFVANLGPAKSGEVRALVGWSAGAGFAIRFAGGRYSELFDRYVFLSPILPGAPTLRPNAGGWTSISTPRVATITWLNRLGIHLLDGFDVISYAVARQNTQGTRNYSYRLFVNFNAGLGFASYLKNTLRPAAVLVGSADEQVVADQFAPLFQRLDVNIPVTVVPGVTHVGMIATPTALKAVANAVSPHNEDQALRRQQGAVR
jgi:pimeloyl-ACP methyl ester carboxylesterase